MIELFEFDARDPEALEAYRRLKHDVFVREGGWDLASSEGRVGLDAFDEAGWFVAAACDALLGVLRVVPWSRGIPYRHMLAALVESCSAEDMRHAASITSLAVRAHWRGRRVVRDEAGPSSTIAQAMVRRVERRMEPGGRCLLVANVSLARAFFFFRKVGFRMLDAPSVYPEHPYPVVTMAKIAGCGTCRRGGSAASRFARLDGLLEQTEATAARRWGETMRPPYAVEQWLPS